MAKILRLILGDQLNSQHSWFQHPDPAITFCMMEVREEATYVTHHVQKILAFFSAMRAFREELVNRGHQVIYYPLDAAENLQDICQNIEHLIAAQQFERFEYMQPDEYRLDASLRALCQKLSVPAAMADTEHFLTPRLFVGNFFAGKKTYRMESLYREMRKKLGILMETDKKPVGGRWNFDVENRKKYDGKTPVPAAKTFDRDVSGLYQLLTSQTIPSIGTVDCEHFPWPATRGESLEMLEDFIVNGLPYFGTFQDAMDTRHPYLFHSRLSFALNTKMLSPLEVVNQSLAYWEHHPAAITLPQIEGFVRQIIGWREYMRGTYWAQMPAYKTLNYFGHDRSLPGFYWTGETRMACMRDAITNSLKNAYAHHIQRLMVTGGFALLAGVHPDAVDDWYLGIYIDAVEWVEITNTRGMSQFADGGIVGTKPYVGSANYINKMSNYCKNCDYAAKQKTGDRACPFNSLYWHFYEHHRDKLAPNPRIGMAYRLLDKMTKTEKNQILRQAEHYLTHLNDL